jgi:hypothetical protein
MFAGRKWITVALFSGTEKAMRMARTAIAVVVFCCACSLLIARDTGSPRANVKGVKGRVSRAVSDYSSAHFLLHTDMPAKEARELLRQIKEGADVCIASNLTSGGRFSAKSHLFAVARSNLGSQVPWSTPTDRLDEALSTF